MKKGKKMEKSFYKNYIEVDKDFEKVMDLIFENNDLLLSYSEEVLFEEGKLLHRKTLLNKNSLINKKVRESIKSDLIDKEKKKEWKVYTKIDTEIESCGSKSQSILEAFDIRNEKKMNIRISRLINVDLKTDLNYGLIVKKYLKILTKVIDINENEIISKIAKNIALKWYPIYSKNIEKVNDYLINKGIGININENEINIKPKIEKENNKSSEYNWGFEKKIKEVFNEKKANSEIVMGQEGSEKSIESKNVYEMVSSIILDKSDLANLYKNKKIVHPKNILRNVDQFEKDNVYGFDEIRKVFDDKIIPKENLSVLKMVSDLFEKILDDENLNSENKVLLCKLQYPIIKTSLISKEEIINDDSVVNKVMKKITNEIKLISDPSSHVFLKIKESVENFSKKDFEKVSFEKIIEEWKKLLSFIEKNERKVSLIEARNKEKELGLYYFKKAGKEVDKDLNSILLDSEFVDPESCYFIENDIRNSLMITKLKDLKDKENKYERQKIVLETWFNSLFVFNNREEANKYSKLLFSMMLENNGSNRAKYSENLRKIYQKVFSRKSDVKDKEKENFQREKYDTYTKFFKESKNISKQEKENPDKKIFEEMEYGDWVEIYSEKVVKNCKLLLKLDNNKRFIFVDSNGKQNLNTTIDNLLEMKSKGSLTIMKKTTVMERALDKILSA